MEASPGASESRPPGRGNTRKGSGQPFWDSLLALRAGKMFVIGPLWFAEALLIFSAGALLWSVRPAARRSGGPVARAIDLTHFPSNGVLALWALATGALAFTLRLVWPVGNDIWGLQLGYFASYLVLFAAGCWAADGRWLERLTPETVRFWTNFFRSSFLCWRRK